MRLLAISMQPIGSKRKYSRWRTTTRIEYSNRSFPRNKIPPRSDIEFTTIKTEMSLIAFDRNPSLGDGRLAAYNNRKMTIKSSALMPAVVKPPTEIRLIFGTNSNVTKRAKGILSLPMIT